MAQDAYLTDQALLAQNPELQDLSRQRKLAEMLTSKAFEQPQGQMISGHYVKPSWTQQLAPLASGIAGQAMGKNLDEKQLKLAEAVRGKKVDENKSIKDAIAAKDWNTAAELIGNSQTGAGKEYMPLIAKYLVPEQRKPQVVSPGGALVDENGKLIYQAPYKPMAGDVMSGMDGEGRFNKKGDYIAPGGVFIGKTEVSKDREIARAANELRQGLKQLTPEEIKATGTILGDVNAGGPISYLAKQFGNPAVAAQAKVNASTVMQTLQNLPPGPASDKDIMMAKSSFPGYGNSEDLQKWIDNTNNLLERKISNVNQKYGSENWYGAQGISNAPISGGNDLAAAAAAERQRRKGNK
jgi:hypothetical protein